ncbi:hypothetical protein [Kibdelosporangium aridum]|uniref:Molecular chaperone DnaJ n=1 Tax=Kibdelosporangium aridum TaxID=2030 RepID=A0A1W2EYC3_KIBAR|nr:hypothetical protein [Kibdelosporangium aridum]SMD14664.1 hypothetical protein SAMN05661093_05091 [Kibdelosporangium aridum]
MPYKVCPTCDGSGLVAPEGVDEPIDCKTCEGEGFIVADDDKEDDE